MAKIYFQYRQMVTALIPPEKNGFKFNCSPKLSVSVVRLHQDPMLPTLTRVRPFSSVKPDQENAVLCVVDLEKEVPPDISKLFNDYIKNPPALRQVTSGLDYYNGRTKGVYQDSNLKFLDKNKNEVNVPEPLLNYCADIKEILINAGSEVLTSLMWRYNCPFDFDERLGQKFSFSFDNKTIGRLPVGYFLDFSATPHIPSYVNKNEVVSLINKGGEKAHRRLIREAWRLFPEHPGPSLFVGVTALEVGVKQYIQAVLPESEWLMENIPSPPIRKIIAGYLPTIPSKRIEGISFAPPSKKFMNNVEEAVTLRNKLTHAGHRVDDLKKLDEALSSFEDLLWLLDYYLGFDWALNYVRKDILAELANGINLQPTPDEGTRSLTLNAKRP